VSLLPAFGTLYWSNVVEPGLENIVEHGQNDRSAKHDNGIVHGRGGDRDCVWPETPEEDGPCIKGTNAVDHDTVVAETETTWWK